MKVSLKSFLVSMYKFEQLKLNCVANFWYGKLNAGPTTYWKLRVKLSYAKHSAFVILRAGSSSWVKVMKRQKNLRE